MAKDFVLTLDEGSERAGSFLKTFGSLGVFVKSFVPELARLPGFDEPQTVYKLDVALLTAEQHERLITDISDRFGIARADVESKIEEHGVPLLASECTLRIENPGRWLFRRQ